MRKTFIITLLLVCGCAARNNNNDGNRILVTIQPLKYIVDEIVGDDFVIEVLVPPGASPETYEPTPAQMKSVETANLVFSTGLIDFERSLLGKAVEKGNFVNLSSGIELIEGTCSHVHDAQDAHEGDNHTHQHGVDPHIWTAPKALLQMAETTYNKIHELYPDSLVYSDNFLKLKARLVELDEIVASRLASAESRSFVIFHPGLTYYARDYGLRQIALEREGKEPSARQLKETVELARAEKISKVMYQREFPHSVVSVVAAEIGAEVVEIDILAYNVVDNILYVTQLIASK